MEKKGSRSKSGKERAREEADSDSGSELERAKKDRDKSEKASREDHKKRRKRSSSGSVAKGKTKEKEKASKDKSLVKDKAKDKKTAKPSKDTKGKAVVKEPVKPDTPGGGAPAGAAKALPAGLGDLAELQKGLEKERSMLQLFVLKAKQEHEEKNEPKDKKARREKEYFKADFGEPCGANNRFLLEEELGRGVFSSVYKCRDMGPSGKEYAIKFIRANPMLRKATEKEIRLMRRLRSEASVEDPEGARCFLGLAGPETFEHQGHLALVFHLQRCDLRTGLQKYGQGGGLPLPLVRNYARDILMALRALRKVNVIHSDLKPDNLLLSLDKASVKLSDFGSAMDGAEIIRTDYLQPRFYRAPEIILSHPYTTQVDIWSAGATIFEIACGRILFTGETNNGMIHEMLKICGAFSKRFATTGEKSAKHFSSKGEFRLKDSSGEQLVPASKFLKPSQTVAQLMDLGKKSPKGTDAAVHQVTVRHIADLVTKCVVLDPATRETPELLLAHKLFVTFAA